MPTGSGKSLCYQLPALLHPGCTVVISPLIALMQDQVAGLQAQGIAATFINSTLSVHEQHERLQACRTGHYKLLYVAPERFRNARFLEAIAQTQVSLFAVDEAHCTPSGDMTSGRITCGSVRPSSLWGSPRCSP